MKASDQETNLRERSREMHVFLFLTVVLAPLISVVVIGAYGLAIWVYQMLAGPPQG